MNKIESYIASVIPKNIPKSKQQILRAEIEAHIYDRIDFYTEIGHDPDASINKALADMGEDEEVKTSIRNDFEELHFEHTWWAVLSALGVFVVNFTAYFLNCWNYFGWSEVSDVIIAPYHFFISFILILAMVLIIVFCYKKGLKKCLVGMSISLFILSITLVYSIYSQLAFTSLIYNISYLLDRFTPFVLKDAVNSVGEIICPPALDFVLGLICVILSKIIKKNGKPKKTKNIPVILFSVFWCVFAVLNAGMYDASTDYFYNYPTWFSDENTITLETYTLFNELNKDTTYDGAVELLSSYGYKAVSEYEKTLDKNTAKKFRFNLNEYDLSPDDSYEIFFNPVKVSENDRFLRKNELIYLSKGGDGKIKAKGIGEAKEDIVLGHSCSEEYDLETCVSEFKKVKVGDDEAEIFRLFGTDYGHPYTKITTYTESGENNYYRFHCDGGYEVDNLYELLPGAQEVSSFQEGQVWIEFFFENGKVTDAKMHYLTTDEWYSIIPQVIELS